MVVEHIISYCVIVLFPLEIFPLYIRGATPDWDPWDDLIRIFQFFFDCEGCLSFQYCRRLFIKCRCSQYRYGLRMVWYYFPLCLEDMLMNRSMNYFRNMAGTAKPSIRQNHTLTLISTIWTKIGILQINGIFCLNADVRGTFVKCRILGIQSSRSDDLFASLGPAPISNTTVNGDWSCIIVHHEMRIL